MHFMTEKNTHVGDFVLFLFGDKKLELFIRANDHVAASEDQLETDSVCVCVEIFQ